MLRNFYGRFWRGAGIDIVAQYQTTMTRDATLYRIQIPLTMFLLLTF